MWQVAGTGPTVRLNLPHHVRPDPLQAKNKTKYNTNKVAIFGESAGGLLCTTVAIKLKRDGNIGMLDGVFAICGEWGEGGCESDK